MRRFLGRRAGRAAAWVFGILLIGPALLAGALYAAPRVGCESAVYSAYPVPGTDWVLEERGPPCGLGGTHPVDLVARNLAGGRSVTLATNDVRVIEIGFAPGQVILRLPNRTLIEPGAMAFGGTRVVYDYQPRDDPADRAGYRRWVTNDQDAEGRRWYCRNVATLPPKRQASGRPCP